MKQIEARFSFRPLNEQIQVDKMFNYLLVAALLPAMTLAAVDFIPCDNNAPVAESLTVNDCSGSVCQLTVGEPLRAVASGIVSPIDSATAEAHIVVRVGGLNMGYEMPPEYEDACTNGIEGGCPLTAGTAFTYIFDSEVLDVPARGTTAEIEVGLTGDGDVALGCLKFNVVVN
ncbi:uncharacterized protein LOC131438221 [Malaya genurostris]|uniref:uncharacterized protein LOC131438221 n=1 Tax=Malaya genurostris TaxID=325434 RepID=UPI0026F39A06|nr:uncharacterized protein LOC131438221 [Malaya genurostris]